MIETRTAPTLEPTTPIKPSEALRLGRLTRPVHNRTGTFLDEDGSACAVGAMLIGWGDDPHDSAGTDDWHTASLRFDPFGIRPMTDIAARYDDAEMDGRDGDAAVLAYLGGLGL